MGVGLLGFLGVGVESSGGSASFSATIVDYIPFISEGLQVTRNDLAEPSLWHNFDERKVYNGQQAIEGNLSVIAHPMTVGYLMRPAFDTVSATQTWGGATSHSGVRAHRFTCGQTQFQAGSGSDLPTMTFEIYRGPLLATAAGSSFMYSQVTGNNFELQIEAGQLTKASLDCVGRQNYGKTASTPTFDDGDIAFTWNQTSVSLGGTGTGLFQSINVRVENNIQAISALDGSLNANLLKRGDFRRVTVNGTTTFQSFAEYDRFIAGSETTLQLTLRGKQISTTPTNFETIYVDIPRFRYSANPVAIGGPGPITVNFQGRAVIDSTSLYPLEITVVNTRISNYATNAAA